VGRIGRNGVAVGRMIVAYSRSDGAATDYEIAWVTVALQYLRTGDDSWGCPALTDRADNSVRLLC
jgi:hypothetical protein